MTNAGTPIYDWIEPDVLAVSKQPADIGTLIHIQASGIAAVISLTEKPLNELLDEAGDNLPSMLYVHLPTPDGKPLTSRDAFYVVGFVQWAKSRGLATLIHCREGTGRVGTAACFYLMAQGYTLERAETEVGLRHFIALTEPQRAWLTIYNSVAVKP
jgi:protein-tyrosine phosphatase